MALSPYDLLMPSVSAAKHPLADPMFMGMQQPPATQQPTQDELLAQLVANNERNNIVKSVVRNTLSGIAYAGGAIDKIGARQIRGALGGQPRELLSFIPFSDTIGITRPEDIVYGGDLLGTRGKKGLGYRAAEFGLEVLLDPTTYMTLGASAVGKGGRALKHAGLYDDMVRLGKKQGMGRREARLTLKPRDVIDFVDGPGVVGGDASKRFARALDELNVQQVDNALDSPIGGLAAYGLPFSQNNTPILQGPRSQQAARQLDKFENLIATSSPGVWAAKAFDRRVEGASTVAGQSASRKHVYEFEKKRRELIENASDLTRRLRRVNLDTDEASDMIREAIEFRNKTDHVIAGLADLSDEQQTVLLEVASGISNDLDELLNYSQHWGVPLEGLSDTISYMARYVTDVLDKKGRTKVFRPEDPSQLARRNYLKHWNGPEFRGTRSIRDVVRDPNIQQIIEESGGVSDEVAPSIAEYIDSTYGNSLIGDGASSAMVQSGEMTPVQWREMVVNDLARTISEMSDEHRAAGMFGNHVNADYLRRTEKGWDAGGRVKTVVQHISDNKNLFDGIPEGAPEEAYISIADFLKESGTQKGGQGKLKINLGDTETGAYRRVLEGLGLLSPGQTVSKHAFAQARKALKNKYIGREVAEDFWRFIDIPSQTAAANDIIKVFDSITSLFKMGVLTWPARYTRDATSAMYQNWLINALDPKDYVKAHKLIAGGQIDAHTIPVIRQRLHDLGLDADAVGAEGERVRRIANDELKNILASVELMDYRQGLSSDIAGFTGTPRVPFQTLEDIESLSPGSNPNTLRKAMSAFNPRAPGTSLNPLDTRGVYYKGPPTSEKLLNLQPRRASTFFIAKGGEEVGHYVESMNRVAPFLTLLRKGYDPSHAALRVAAAQVDYRPSMFTSFEREYLARVFPFYRFTSRQIPFQLRELMEKPGGKVAQTIRGISTLRDPDQALPEHISQTAAIPVGGAPEGFQRHVVGLGLPLEDVFGLFRPGTTAYKTTQGTLQEFFGRLHPLVKAPIELASGTQFFSGRDLQDLRGTVSDIIYNAGITDAPPAVPILFEQMVSSSPVSRLASTVRTILDPRKGIAAKAVQLGTGIRLTDTDLENAKNLALRGYLEDLLRPDPNVRRFSHLYAPDVELLSPRNQQLMDLYKTLGAESAKRARDRKKASSAE